MTKSYIEARGDLYGRSIPEWIGATPDTPVPAKVALRVLLRQSRRCAKTGRLIRAGDKSQADHIISLKRGGENREGNLQVILTEEHIEKTATENSEDAKVERIQKKHYGMAKSRHRWPRQKLRKVASQQAYSRPHNGGTK